jgi:hypothetical protein
MVSVYFSLERTELLRLATAQFGKETEIFVDKQTVTSTIFSSETIYLPSITTTYFWRLNNKSVYCCWMDEEHPWKVFRYGPIMYFIERDQKALNEYRPEQAKAEQQKKAEEEAERKRKAASVKF